MDDATKRAVIDKVGNSLFRIELLYNGRKLTSLADNYLEVEKALNTYFLTTERPTGLFAERTYGRKTNN